MSQNHLTFPNPVNASRVRIGIGNTEILLVKQSNVPYAPLVPVLDEPQPETYECCVEGCSERTDPRNTMYCPEHFFSIGKGAELSDLPTARELDELYLVCAGWTRVEGIGTLWQDPFTGGAYDFADAVALQDQREEMEARGQ